jgi:ABC-type nitrate/sulfonate/bicarbonate transport system substrate-binding protein
MRRVQTGFRIAIPLGFAFFLAGCAEPIIRKPEPQLRIAVDAGNPILQLPVYVAMRQRLFAGERLRMSLAESGDAEQATAALLRGECQFASAGFEQVLRSAENGKPLTAFLLLSRSPMLAVVGTGRPAPPRGGAAAEKVGIVGQGDSTDLFAHYLTRGITVPKGSLAVVATAFERRQVSIAVLDAVNIEQLIARKAPLVLLSDTRTVAGLLATYGVSHYPASCIYSAPGWMAEHEDQLRRFGKAMAASLEWIRKHGGGDCAAMLPDEYRRSVDAAALASAVEQMRPLFSPDGAITADGAGQVRKVLAASDERFRNKDVPPSAYTTSFVFHRP